jgi:hypothetical protein
LTAKRKKTSLHKLALIKDTNHSNMLLGEVAKGEGVQIVNVTMLIHRSLATTFQL